MKQLDRDGLIDRKIHHYVREFFAVSARVVRTLKKLISIYYAIVVRFSIITRKSIVYFSLVALLTEFVSQSGNDEDPQL